jgi:hypothetical protein
MWEKKNKEKEKKLMFVGSIVDTQMLQGGSSS